MGRNLLICLDGTNNEPEVGSTNVVRFYAIASKDPFQLAFYGAGVGTMGARGAMTRLGAASSRLAGTLVGHGIKDDIADAYGWLAQNYRAEDRIFIVGFSRGAYTALALTGMLRTVGLLRPGADNLVPYALKLYARHGKERPTKADDAAFFEPRDRFNRVFGNPEFPNRFAPQVAFLGLWETVKAVGWFNARARWEEARWPFTRIVPNVEAGRLALALDENRRPYREYRFSRSEVARNPGRLQEVWFAGVHSDVGGQFPDDHRLSDIALSWMIKEAVEAGLRVDETPYRRMLGVGSHEALPADHALGRIHTNSPWWYVAGPGWHRRLVRPGDAVHPSVNYRFTATAGSARPYRADLGEVLSTEPGPVTRPAGADSSRRTSGRW